MLKLKLDEILQKRERSAYSVAKETGIGQQTLWRLRHDKTLPNPKTLNLLCKVLDCQPGDLLEYIPDKPAPKSKRASLKRR